MFGGRSHIGTTGLAGTDVSRRTVLRWSGAAGMLAATSSVVACAPPEPGSDADANGVLLLPGFTSRIIATAGEPVANTGFEFRAFPDGAATYVDAEVPGGWYLAVNHEVPGGGGGVSSIRFAPDGTVTGAYSICNHTSLNCAGGATPWGTWLTGEEWSGGHIWECDPTGARPAQRRRQMGAFKHEAAAVASDGKVYLTEDEKDGAFYRFTPDTPGDLSTGRLEVATGPQGGGTVSWQRVPVTNPAVLETATRFQVADTMRFDGGEGIATLGDLVWFSTKGDNRIWQYELSTQQVSVAYQAGGSSTLSGVDNLWVDAPTGNLFVAEDGDDMQVVLLRPDDTVLAVAQLPGQETSEITGPCFSPDGQRLYFSSQRNPVGPGNLPLGRTYEISGPWDALLGRS